MEVRPMAAELFHADGRTDMTKLTVALRKFANAPKNLQLPKQTLSFNRDNDITIVLNSTGKLT
jgi:hypothetical protein